MIDQYIVNVIRMVRSKVSNIQTPVLQAPYFVGTTRSALYRIEPGQTGWAS